MGLKEISDWGLALSPEKRLMLARILVESVCVQEMTEDDIAKAMRRIEDVATGKVRGLTETEFLAELG